MPATIKILPGLGYFFIFTEETIVFRLHVFIPEKQYAAPVNLIYFRTIFHFYSLNKFSGGVINGTSV